MMRRLFQHPVNTWRAIGTSTRSDLTRAAPSSAATLRLDADGLFSRDRGCTNYLETLTALEHLTLCGDRMLMRKADSTH